MTNVLQSKAVAFLGAAEGTEQSELITPWEPVMAAGGHPVLVSPGAVAGRTLRSWPSLRTDLLNAGADWVDEEVVTCTKQPSVLVTSRKPQDLPAFCETMTAVFGEHR